jgi:DNA-directed RNA polymerase specialized sigma24 family protein
MAEVGVEDVWKRERTARLSTTPLLRVVHDLPVRDAADLLGVNVGTLMKWRASEGTSTIHYARADRIAIRLGCHPSAMWGREWWSL